MNLKRLILAIYSLSLFCFASCNQVGDGYTGKTKEPTELAYFNDEMSKFSSIKINKETTFKIGENDSIDANINKSYQLGKYVVTRDLWSHVYRWATDENLASKEGRSVYKFSSKSNIGIVEAKKKEPMANVTFKDAVVWCNALTEYLNYLHKDDKKWVELFPVYYRKGNDVTEAFDEFVRMEDKNNARRTEYFKKLNGMVLRESGEPTDSQGKKDAGMEFNDFYEFNGYRLPTNVEWEFASRLTKNPLNSYDATKKVTLDGVEYYLLKGLCLSGSNYFHSDKSEPAKEANSSVATNFGKLIKGDTSHSEYPLDVATTKANAIGLFDMSGNVWEWTLPVDERRIVLKKATGNNFILNDKYPYANDNGENRKKGGSYRSTKTEEYAVGFVGKFPMKSDDTNKENWQKKDIGFRLAKTDINFF
ncbi:MAG: SUMF1/EgtB/PvdO family nonheme iron enzyme [Treponema sp.]